jgi:hypothetical protein
LEGDAVPRRLKTRDAESVLVAYIDLFADAVEKRTLRHDTIADLDKAIRLLAYVRGQAESTKAVHVSISLDAMQQRHREYRAHVIDVVDDEVAGVIGAGSGSADDGSPGDDASEGEAWDAEPDATPDAAE